MDLSNQSQADAKILRTLLSTKRETTPPVWNLVVRNSRPLVANPLHPIFRDPQPSCLSEFSAVHYVAHSTPKDTSEEDLNGSKDIL